MDTQKTSSNYQAQLDHLKQIENAARNAGMEDCIKGMIGLIRGQIDANKQRIASLANAVVAGQQPGAGAGVTLTGLVDQVIGVGVGGHHVRALLWS